MTVGARLVVLGGTGFIGGAVVGQAWRLGLSAFSVGSSAVDLTSANAGSLLLEYVDERTILVFAARASQGGDPWSAFRDDQLMTVNVARLLARQRLLKCVFISSLAVYGDTTSNLDVTEETPLAPSSPYAGGKVAGECLFRQAAARSSTPLLILRPAMVYGPGDTSTAYGPGALLAAAVRDGRVSIFGDGADRRPYVHIADASQLIINLAIGPYEGMFNLASADSHSFEEIASILRGLTGPTLEVECVPRQRPRVDLRVTPRALRRVFPEHRFRNLRDGLSNTFASAVAASGLAESRR